MSNPYNRPLDVSDTKGKRIVAKIRASFNKVFVHVDYIEEVKKDNPKFANDGVINFACLKDRYKEVMIKVTKYLKDLFLKGISNEDLHTSINISNNRSRSTRKDKPGKITGVEREGSTTGIRISARGGK